MRFADVIVDISLEKLDRTYQYSIPEELTKDVFIGARVLVPFGKGTRTIQGFVMDITDNPKFSVEKTKPILGIAPGAVTMERRLLTLAGWMREHFGGTMNEALKTVLPVKKEIKENCKKTIQWKADQSILEEYTENARKKNYRARLQMMEYLREHVPADYSQTVRDGISVSAITDAVKNDIIEIAEERVYRNTAKGVRTDIKKVLNPEQQAAVDTVWKEYQEGIRNPYLLFGVTGSGKTEVYLELIERMLSEKKQVIVLIPEISLTFQTVSRFYERFGERVSVLHSRLSAGERYDQYVRAKKGEIDIMIGPRSALFTPFEKLGMIIVDEEQETAYKSENTPKYHARETAEFLGKLTDSVVVFGSATPSLEAYTAALQGRYHLLRLTKRAKEAQMPRVYIADMRKELATGNFSMFSRTLKEEIRNRLAKQEQVMLFLNRRGYAGAVSCRSCGTGLSCPHCEISLTYHKGGILRCHYCGYETGAPKLCPSCGSKYIGLFGTGTQKVEEAVRREFPEAKILRMDADTTKNKGDHEKIVSAFAAGEAQILIGTQMIVKGHDFKRVTLVGILAADLSLNAGDYRACERTFCLLAQAAGRAGRDQIPGEVVIQTYQPDHYSIVCAANENYEEFYRREMQYRKMLNYPPVVHLMVAVVMSEKEENAKIGAEKIYRAVKNFVGPEEKELQEPVQAGLFRANDMYRYLIYMKSENATRLFDIYRIAEEAKNNTEETLGCRILFDFDPYSGY